MLLKVVFESNLCPQSKPRRLPCLVKIIVFLKFGLNSEASSQESTVEMNGLGSSRFQEILEHFCLGLTLLLL